MKHEVQTVADEQVAQRVGQAEHKAVPASKKPAKQTQLLLTSLVVVSAHPTQTLEVAQEAQRAGQAVQAVPSWKKPALHSQTLDVALRLAPETQELHTSLLVTLQSWQRGAKQGKQRVSFVVP